MTVLRHPESEMLPSKHCKYCNKTRPLSDFCKRKISEDGLSFKCRECDKEYRKGRGSEIYKNLRQSSYQKNRKREQQSSLGYYRANRDRCIRRHLKYMKDTKEQQKAYRDMTRAQRNEITRRYRLGREQRTPSWLTNDHVSQLKSIYARRELLEKQSGLALHVDHIVPLRGTMVSGLHVPWNLQIVPAGYNLSKGNRCGF